MIGPGESHKPSRDETKWEAELTSGSHYVEGFDLDLLRGEGGIEFLRVRRPSERRIELDRARAATEGLQLYLDYLNGTGSKRIFHELLRPDGWLRVAISKANRIHRLRSLPQSARLIVATEYQTGVITPFGEFEVSRTVDAVVDHANLIAVSSSASKQEEKDAEFESAWGPNVPGYVGKNSNDILYVRHGRSFHPQMLPKPPGLFPQSEQAAQYGQYTDTVRELFDYFVQLGPSTQVHQ